VFTVDVSSIFLKTSDEASSLDVPLIYSFILLLYSPSVLFSSFCAFSVIFFASFA